jgi:hypothetical protein
MGSRLSGTGAVDVGKRCGPRLRIHPLPQTRGVPTFSLAVSVRVDTVPGNDVVDALSTTLRPGDDDLMVWRDADPAVLRLSTDCPAADLDEAVALGRELADDALALSRRAGAVLEVVAMDDERQLVWRAEP